MSVPAKRCAETYEANKEVVDAHTADVLPTILEKMEWGNNELILDHGCATGSTTFKYLVPYAEKSNSTIYALDHSESMTKFGSENFGHPKIKYVHGSLAPQDSNPVKDLKFNKIFSIYTLHFIDDYKGEIKALYDSLASGGELFMTILLQVHTFDMYAQIMDHEHWADYASEHLVIPKWLTESDEENHEMMKNAFLETGFEIKEFNDHERMHTFKKPGIYADMMLALNAFGKHLSHEHFDKLKDKYHRFFAETETKGHKPHAESANSEYTLHYDALDVVLKKP